MVSVHFWKGLTEKIRDIDPNISVASLRTTLKEAGVMTETDQFLYYDKMNEEEKPLNFQVEPKRKASELIDGSKINITDPKTAQPDLIGVITPWLWNRCLGVQVQLNMGEPGAQSLNGNRFQPMMMTNVRGSNPSIRSNFNQVIVCEKGSQIKFHVESWCPAGFGYRIRPDRGVPIANRLYILSNKNGHSGRLSTDLLRYEQSQQLIDVQATADMKIPGQDALYYQKITVQSWRVMEYETESGAMFSSDAQPPLEAYDPGRMPTFGGEQRGGVLPGESIQAGMPTPGAPSTQTFGRVRRISRQDNPDGNQVLGEVVFYVFVFRDREAAEKVIQGVNAPDGSPYA